MDEYIDTEKKDVKWEGGGGGERQRKKEGR